MNRWDDAFVDALCDPPQSFTFGGAVAHVLTFSAHRRQVLIDAIRELRPNLAFEADPIEWERQAAAPQPHRSEDLRGDREPRDAVSTQQDIEDAIRSWWQAMADHDLDVLRTLALPDYLSSGGPDGRELGRDRLLAAAAEFFAHARTECWRLEDLEVRQHRSAAVCSYRWSERGEHGGRPYEIAGVATDTLVLSGGRWRMQAHHVSMVAE